MQYLILIYEDEKLWGQQSPEQMRTAMGAYRAYTESMKASSVYVGGNALQPTSTATTLRGTNAATQVIDGPFAETKEQLGGYYLIEAPDLDTALLWGKRCPVVATGSVEVRPIMTY